MGPRGSHGPPTDDRSPRGRHGRALDALIPLLVAWASGIGVAGSLLLELHVHHSRALAVAGMAPIVVLVAWFGRREGDGWNRRSIVATVLRAGVLVGLLVAMLAVFDVRVRARDAWALWIPAMMVDFLPAMARALPWLVVACALGLAVTWWALVVRRGVAPFTIAFAWPAAWAFLAFNGFYRASFAHVDAAVVKAQLGVRVYAENAEASCSLFAKTCSTRVFPRAIGVDGITRTVFASFGSTAADVDRGQPKLAAVRLDDDSFEWLEGSDEANQLRNFAVSPAHRILVGSAWGSRAVSVWSLDTHERLQHIPWTVDLEEDYAPFNTLVDGDRIYVNHVWYPRIVVYSRTTGSIERMVDLNEAGVVANGVQLVGAALSPRRGRMWVALARPGPNVLELDLATLRPMRLATLDVMFPASFTYDDRLGRLFVTSLHDERIEVVDVDAMKRVDVLEGVLGSRDTAVDADRGILFVTDYLNGEVAFLSLRERRITRRVVVGPKPGGVVPFGDRVFVNSAVGIVSIPIDLAAGGGTGATTSRADR